jgi:hypothetical protein
MAKTYEPIATYTVTSPQSSYTFTSIPSTYTDLVVTCSFGQSSAYSVEARIGNGSVDTGNNYSNTTLHGKANNAVGSTRRSNYSYLTFFEQYGALNGVWTMNFMNYANTSVNKTMIARNGNSGSDVEESVHLWRSTSAINTLQLLSGQGSSNFSIGTIFTIYGIKAA